MATMSSPVTTTYSKISLSGVYYLLSSNEITILRATSHTTLKACDHCNLRALIGWNGGDCPSSLHTQMWKPKGSIKTSWLKSLHRVLHDGQWIRFHNLPKFLWGPPPRGGPHANSGRPWLFFFLFFFNMIDFKTDKHHQVILLNWYSLKHIILNQILPSFSANKIWNGPATWSILTSHYAWGPVTT